MQGAAVGLYCAVVDRFDLSVPTRGTPARETQAAFNQRAESLRTWLGALNLGLVDGRPQGLHRRLKTVTSTDVEARVDRR